MGDLPISPFIDFEPESRLFRYDESKAERVIRFIETFCVHTKGRFAGKPFLLTDWQKNEIIRPLYGHMQWDTQLGAYRRQYSIAWLEMARKQGKSQLLSALGLYHLVADGEESAEVYGVAADRDQASLVFNVAKRIVELSPRLRGWVEIIDSKKRLVYAKTNSFYQVLPGDAAGALGVNASAVLFDEVLTQRDRHLWDAMRQSFGTRVQPLMIAATTAAYTSAAFALAEHEHSVQVQDKPWIDPNRFVFARNLPTDWDFRDEGVPPCPEFPKGTGWYYVAPGLGDFFSIETMRAELREAESRPQTLQSFRVFRLNQWTSQAERWLDMEVWDANGTLAFTRDALKGRLAFGALDLASTQDFTAWLLLFPGSPHDPEAGGFTVLPHFFVPRPAVEMRSNMADRMAHWEREGFITVTEGVVTDYSVILEHIGTDAETFRIRMIGYDPWNATHLISLIEDRGQPTVKVPQTAPRLNDPCKALESGLAERQMFHGGHPVLRWMADNVELEVTGDGLMKPSKKKSGEKIDGIAALVTALFVASIPMEEDPEVNFIDFNQIRTLGEEGITDEEQQALAEFLEAWNADDD
ncbi:terminase large subunit [Catellatospora sichuanensis]|uniref:terminase large subunit n=1 Tax=Catellatospora sichuanensis TaxID=1969805 RepID=UPI001183BE9E|nr:terminase TerL endonuclease subunit [Catellatospora sichuanensis]